MLIKDATSGILGKVLDFQRTADFSAIITSSRLHDGLSSYYENNQLNDVKNKTV